MNTFYGSLLKHAFLPTLQFEKPFIPQFPEAEQIAQHNSSSSLKSMNFEIIRNVSEPSSTFVNSVSEESSSSNYEAIEPKIAFEALPPLLPEMPKFALALPKERVVDELFDETCRALKQDKLDEYLPQINQIGPNIFISGCIPAEDVNLLSTYNIASVLNLSGDLITEPANKKLINFILRVKDGNSERIDWCFYECFAFIYNSIRMKQNVLIHCHEGVSRSSAVTIGYLMETCNWTFLEAFSLLKDKRKICQPNSGFICELVDLWRERHSNLILELRCEEISQRKHLNIDVNMQEIAARDPTVSDMLGNRLIRCDMPSSEAEIKPQIWKLTYLYNEQRIIVLKREHFDKDIKLDSRFVYIVEPFYSKTIIMLGKDVPGFSSDDNFVEMSLSGRSLRVGNWVEESEIAEQAKWAENDAVVEYESSDEENYLNNPVMTHQITDRQSYGLLVRELDEIDLNTTLKRALLRQLCLLEEFERISIQLLFCDEEVEDETIIKERTPGHVFGVAEFLGWTDSRKKFTYEEMQTSFAEVEFEKLKINESFWARNPANDDEAKILENIIE